MEKYVLQIAFHVLLVLVLVLRCGTVPVRLRRQVQDLPLLHEDIDHDDYSTDNSDNPIVDDDTLHLSPHEESHLQGNVDYADHLDTNRNFSSDHAGISSDTGAGDIIRDFDFENEHDQRNIQPGIDHDGHVNENPPGSESYVTGHLHFQGQGNLPSSRQNNRNPSSVSQGHVEVISTTKGTTDSEHLVINAVGRSVHVNMSTSEGRQNHHGFLMGENVNVNTSEERHPHHGFLMGDNIQNVDNEHGGLNTNTLTSRSLTILHSRAPATTTTTTPEPIVTVRLSNISSREWTESAAQEHVHTNIIIDRTDQNIGGRSDHDLDNVDRPGQSYNDGKNMTTEIPLTVEGQVATLPGEPNVQGQNHENEEHLSGHEETEGHEHDIDVPIDKGDHPHTGNNEEHNHPGPPRHTNNPVVGTRSRTENLPVTEPIFTTPKLIILPTPSNLEPDERNTSAIIQEPQSSVIFQGDRNEHTETDHEGQGHPGVPGESGIHENTDHENRTEERQFTTGEGHIEFITELPEIHGEPEIKPHKNLPKHTDKINETPSLISPSSLVFEFESFTSDNVRFVSESRPTATEEYHPESSTIYQSFSSFSESGISSNNPDVTEVPENLQSSTLGQTDIDNLETTSTMTFNPCSQSDYQLCHTASPSNSVPGYMLLSSHSIIPVKQSAMVESSTPSLTDTALIGIVGPSTTVPKQVVASSSVTVSTKTAVPEQVISSSSVTFSTTAANENTPNLLESSVSEVKRSTTSILPTQTIDQLSETSKTMLSTEVRNVGTSVTLLTASPISATPASSEVHYSSTENFLLTSSANAAPLQPTLELTSQSPTPVTTVTQTIPVSVTFPMLTSNPTTKKKEDHSSTTTPTTTRLTTQKKPDTEKEPEKPENRSSSISTSAVSTSGRTSSSVYTTTTSRIITTTLPSTSRTITTQEIMKQFEAEIEISTPPSVYIEIELRMDWSQFCLSKSQFISEIREIMRSEKGNIVDEGQFILSTVDCRSANNILLEEEHLKSITIEMYIVGTDGKLDIWLTTVTSSVISKGFQQSNYLKDKIVSVHTVNRKQPETLPESKSDRRQEPASVAMVIVLASMGGVCCVALVILQVLIHRRVKAKRKQRQFVGQRASLQSMDHVALGVIPKSRPNSGYWNPALDDTLELPEPDEHSHLLNFSGLANFCMDTKAIYTEFQTIPFDNVDLTSVPIGEEDKNRFANVLPHKHSRVSLKKTQDNKSDILMQTYVRCNYYKASCNHYIKA
ncbi:uncharacterized protein LOC123522941 [Mercenaria mercenaria]|uniref:uncharacterized protein LOC123522941 n=1 Tax=Mercenaria mercenaria TaxID=6596 RepID=UPI00234FA7D9|nr:uncharacterized protein LOC123522941 [Mercenaria mercenaria]